MRILFVAMAHSIHTARWISQITDQGWDIHVFPLFDAKLHPLLQNVTAHPLLRRMWGARGIRQTGIPWPLPRGAARAARLLRAISSRMDDAERLAELIARLKPDIVHTLEMQRAGYLTMAARRLLSSFPPWIYSSWGNDLFLFGKLPQHRPLISEVLSNCDYFVADCHRDVLLASQLGFEGEVLGVFPVPGGYHVDAMRQYRTVGPVSHRKVIAIKGYQDDQYGGRGLVAVQAVRLCAEALQGFEVVFFSAQVADAANSLRQHGLHVSVMPTVPHIDLIRLLGRARIHVALSTSDGTPNSMLEAMVMGAFPIQSDTISTGEWIDDGRNGLLVPPEDPERVAEALRRAVVEDELVDAAADHNGALTKSAIDIAHVKPRVLAMYRRIIEGAQPHLIRSAS